MRHRKPLACSIAILIGLAGTYVTHISDAGTAQAMARIHGTNFFSDCRLSHAAPDDPIVHFGIRGGSHPHDFFGNTSTNAYSTLASLRRHGTTCGRSADTAAYWVPALYQDGAVVKPLGIDVYYQLRTTGRIEAFPPGLKIVAGNAAATSPQSTKVVFWDCAYPPGPGRHVSSPPKCPPRRPTMRRFRPDKAHLLLNVNFPDCWDGRRLDSSDHQTHMAYSVNLRCPRSHPVKVPKLRLSVMYPTRGGSGLAFASGGLISGHADFFNAWNQSQLERIVAACSAEKPHCAAAADK